MIHEIRETQDVPEGISLQRSTSQRAQGESDYLSVALLMPGQPLIRFTAYATAPGEPIAWDLVSWPSVHLREVLASGSLDPIPDNYYSDDPQPLWAGRPLAMAR